MTREEAIAILESEKPCNNKTLKYSDDVLILALDMAIKALEQESCEDVISRQAVYEMLDSMLDDSSDNKRNQLVSLDSIADEIAELPSVKPQEPKTEKVFKMRDATLEERESVNNYVKSISKPTGGITELF